MSQVVGLMGVMPAVVAGASFVVHQAVNADLRTILNSGAWAGFVSYLGGTLCMLVLALALHDAVPAVNELPRNNWWAWTGGFFGAIYISISIVLVPRLGTATFVAVLVAGQMLAALVIDHYGLIGIPRHSADASRMLGAGLLICGVILIRR